MREQYAFTRVLRLLLLIYLLSMITWVRPAFSAPGDLVEFFNAQNKLKAGAVLEENETWVTVTYPSPEGYWVETLPAHKVRRLAGNAVGAQIYFCKNLLQLSGGEQKSSN